MPRSPAPPLPPLPRIISSVASLLTHGWSAAVAEAEANLVKSLEGCEADLEASEAQTAKREAHVALGKSRILTPTLTLTLTRLVAPAEYRTPTLTLTLTEPEP